MSRLDKLNIIGVRSFGPDDNDRQQITFRSPLTLFLGQNGCGKTTIIEALKYACSGDLPPGCKRGQGFVHDPKLASRSEIKGQVKLRVICSNGDQIVVCKSMVATQKANNKLEFKSLDSALSRTKAGQEEPQSISGRCVDIDVEMCVAMGVSKAILNNVIFCHQEDSNWPMEDGKKLKEIFDAIFDATKYNKCLEYMRKLKKTKQNENKVMFEHVKGLEHKKLEVDQKKKNLRETERKVAKAMETVRECEEKIKPVAERLEELKKLETEWNTRSNNIQMKKSRIEELKKDMKQMLPGLKIFEGSDAELTLTIAEFEKQLLKKETQLDELVEQLKAKGEEEQTFLKEFAKEQVLQGQLRNEEKQNESRVAKRDKLLIPLSHQLEMTLAPIHNSLNAKDVFDSIESKISERKNAHEDLIQELDEEDQKLQANVDTCLENKISMEQNIKSKMQQLKDTKIEVRKKRKEVDEANASSSHLEIIQDKLERNAKDYDSLTGSLNPEELAQQIATHSKVRDTAEVDLEVVDKEVTSLQLLSNLQTELDLQKENALRVETDVKKLKNKHEEAFNQIFNGSLPETTFKTALDKIKKEIAAKIREFNQSIKKAQKKVTELESDVKYRKERLKILEKELADNEKMIYTQCEGRPLAAVVAEMKTKLERLQLDKGNYSNSKYMFTRFIELLGAEDPTCPICKRDFHEKEPTFVKDIVTDISKQIDDFPSKLKSIESELVAKQKQYNKLVQLETVDERISTLRNEDIPKITEEITELEANLQTARTDLETFQTGILKPQESQELVQSVASDVAILDKSQSELKKLKQKITDLEEQKAKACPSTRTLQEAINEQESLKSTMTTARRQESSLQKRLNNYNEQKQYLQETKNKLVQQQLNIEKNLQGIAQIKERFAELTANESRLSTEVATLEGELMPLKKELTMASDKKSTAKKDHKKKIDKNQAEILNIQKHFQEIKNIQIMIDEFADKQITEKLNQVLEKITKLEIEKKEHAEEKANIQVEVDKIKNFLATQKTIERGYKDNQNLREKQKEEEVVKTEMEALQSEGQKENIQHILKEKKRLNESHNSITSDRNRAEGRRIELSAIVEDYQKDLAKDHNIKAEANYKHKYMELKVREKVVDDLQKFTQAVDQAITLYHQDKMGQINLKVKELWRTIYRGNDCDYIEIKTEQTTTTGKDARRTYNYRVVQVKNGIELDMRGRCSAGQRVLASLIIRIALAETFSSNCGVLALDEPTTNLDRENIVALSDALAEIVHHKRMLKHFQLIVITHDKQFLESLSAVERLETYYLVSRNNEGKSTVKEMPTS